jgi:hypothetical protein
MKGSHIPPARSESVLDNSFRRTNRPLDCRWADTCRQVPFNWRLHLEKPASHVVPCVCCSPHCRSALVPRAVAGGIGTSHWNRTTRELHEAFRSGLMFRMFSFGLGLSACRTLVIVVCRVFAWWDCHPRGVLGVRFSVILCVICAGCRSCGSRAPFLEFSN